MCVCLFPCCQCAHASNPHVSSLLRPERKRKKKGDRVLKTKTNDEPTRCFSRGAETINNRERACPPDVFLAMCTVPPSSVSVGCNVLGHLLEGRICASDARPINCTVLTKLLTLSLHGNIAGIPRMHWYGTEGSYNALVIDLLGPNLKQVRRENEKFPLSFVIELGVQMVRAVSILFVCFICLLHTSDLADQIP